MDIDCKDLHCDHKKFSKIMFIFNALEDGWSIKKRGPKYIFSKHKSKEKEIFYDNYLELFLKKYFQNLEK